MKNPAIKSLFCIVLICACLFSGCARRDKRTDNSLYEICASLSLPAGETFLSDAKEGEANFLSRDTADSLYGKGCVERTFPLIAEYAVYISSFAEPCEVAVFKCYSRTDTDTVSEMCLERADEISVLLKNTEYASVDARIITRQKYVVMLLCEDTDKAAEAARKALK